MEYIWLLIADDDLLFHCSTLIATILVQGKIFLIFKSFNHLIFSVILQLRVRTFYICLAEYNFNPVFSIDIRTISAESKDPDIVDSDVCDGSICNVNSRWYHNGFSSPYVAIFLHCSG